MLPTRSFMLFPWPSFCEERSTEVATGATSASRSGLFLPFPLVFSPGHPLLFFSSGEMRISLFHFSLSFRGHRPLVCPRSGRSSRCDSAALCLPVRRVRSACRVRARAEGDAVVTTHRAWLAEEDLMGRRCRIATRRVAPVVTAMLVDHGKCCVSSSYGCAASPKRRKQRLAPHPFFFLGSRTAQCI
jgi:hypothetical protein